MGPKDQAGHAAERSPRPGSLAPPVGAETALQRELIAVWEQALTLEPIGIDDDYFELGGDSFVAMAIFAAISEDLEVSMPMSTLMFAPTIRELAEEIEKVRAEG
jgi:phthiocerol/phenolphthiocerol synthesis type-I polyketide synthase E